MEATQRRTGPCITTGSAGLLHEHLVAQGPGEAHRLDGHRELLDHVHAQTRGPAHIHPASWAARKRTKRAKQNEASLGPKNLLEGGQKLFWRFLEVFLEVFEVLEVSGSWVLGLWHLYTLRDGRFWQAARSEYKPQVFFCEWKAQKSIQTFPTPLKSPNPKTQPKVKMVQILRPMTSSAKSLPPNTVLFCGFLGVKSLYLFPCLGFFQSCGTHTPNKPKKQNHNHCGTHTTYKP